LLACLISKINSAWVWGRWQAFSAAGHRVRLSVCRTWRLKYVHSLRLAVCLEADDDVINR
jgi:hypothetical protein